MRIEYSNPNPNVFRSWKFGSLHVLLRFSSNLCINALFCKLNFQGLEDNKPKTNDNPIGWNVRN